MQDTIICYSVERYSAGSSGVKMKLMGKPVCKCLNYGYLAFETREGQLSTLDLIACDICMSHVRRPRRFWELPKFRRGHKKHNGAGHNSS